LAEKAAHKIKSAPAAEHSNHEDGNAIDISGENVWDLVYSVLNDPNFLELPADSGDVWQLTDYLHSDSWNGPACNTLTWGGTFHRTDIYHFQTP
jgi:hypothetical protein